MDDRTDLQVIMDQLNEAIGYLTLLDKEPRKIISYFVIRAKNIFSLCDDVTESIKLGYGLQGSIAYIDGYYSQAMVKYEERATNDNNGIYG